MEENKELKVEEKIKKLYSQQWHEYNEAQTKEKIISQRLLMELLENIEEPKQRTGRPGTPLREKIFCMFLYSYGGFSSGRTISDFEI